ncbi:MAG: SDR family oxidoreductase [Spirochaetes bacterium]|nr:SDR family oxidoreductase [Spirochaetota bacterium]
MNNSENIKIFNGGVAIVTGGASGIGKSLGKALASRGCTVVLADINGLQAKKTAEEIRAEGGRAWPAELDVTDFNAVKAVVNDTINKYGRLDYIFNNAGIGINGKFQDFETKDWERCININLRGVIHGVRAAFPVMEKQGFGHIINTASTAGIFPWPTSIAYTTVKHAVVGLSTALRAELAHTGVRISVLCPGTIQTPLIEQGGRDGRWVGPHSEEKVVELFNGSGAMNPDKFAEKALKQIAKNKPVMVIPSGYKILWWMYRLSPSFGITVSSKISQTIFKKVE